MNKSEILKLNLPSRDNTTDIADINAISDNFKTIDGAFGDLVEKIIPKLQTKENINLNFDDNSTNEEQYPNVPAVVNFTNRKVDPLKIINSASGNAISLKDSAKDKLVNLKLYGKTTQDGTPTPTEPKELKSVGDSGSFEVGVYGSNLFEPIVKTETQYGLTITVDEYGTITANGTLTTDTYSIVGNVNGKGKLTFTPNWSGRSNNSYLVFRQSEDKHNQIFLNAITVEKTTNTSAIVSVVFRVGTYSNLVIKPMINIGETALPYEPYKAKQSLTLTDTLRSVGDIKDEVDFNRGVLIQRIKEVLAENYTLYPFSTDYEDYFVAYIDSTGLPAKNIGISSHLPYIPSGLGNKTGFFVGIYTSPIHISIPKTIASDATTLRQWLIDNNVKFYYPMATPIETPLSETELNAYRHLMTNKGNTTILNGDGADMEISYVADPKLYIDNKIAELTALTLEV